MGSRAHLLPELLAALDGFDDVQVLADPGGRRPSSWRTHRMCLDACPDDATHLLIVQDDALLCPGFHVKTVAAIMRHPERLIAFFAPGFPDVLQRFHRARRAGERYTELRVGPYVPTVCLCLPAEHARAIPAFADAKRITPSRADDAVIATYARAHRLGVLATVPCLAEHRADEASAMGMRNRPGAPHRVAASFVM